ncbi:MAG: hypothetical protein AB7D57_12285 [Desulfovibrionaceae bacterium]
MTTAPRRPRARRAAPGLLLLAALLLPAVLLGPPGPARAAGPGNDPAAQEAKWRQEEQQCISKCPKFPRFGGTENDRQYRQRLQAEDDYNRCYARCVRDYMRKTQLKVQRLNDGSDEYYKRNGDAQP